MLRTTNPQASLWKAILPAEALGLPSELTTVDRLLDDPVLSSPSAPTSTPPVAARLCRWTPTCG